QNAPEEAAITVHRCRAAQLVVQRVRVIRYRSIEKVVPAVGLGSQNSRFSCGRHAAMVRAVAMHAPNRRRDWTWSSSPRAQPYGPSLQARAAAAVHAALLRRAVQRALAAWLRSVPTDRP